MRSPRAVAAERLGKAGDSETTRTGGSAPAAAAADYAIRAPAGSRRGRPFAAGTPSADSESRRGDRHSEARGPGDPIPPRLVTVCVTGPGLGSDASRVTVRARGPWPVGATGHGSGADGGGGNSRTPDESPWRAGPWPAQRAGWRVQKAGWRGDARTPSATCPSTQPPNPAAAAAAAAAAADHSLRVARGNARALGRPALRDRGFVAEGGGRQRKTRRSETKAEWDSDGRWQRRAGRIRVGYWGWLMGATRRSRWAARRRRASARSRTSRRDQSRSAAAAARGHT